jgi:hypothetical protein
MIDEITADTDAIILAFGLCSNAVVGLTAEKSMLIVPRVDDCIGMFLGSRESYKEHLSCEPGTYFLSKGWIEAGITLVEEFKEMETRYGIERAERIQRAMLGNYTRLAYIDMGHADQKGYRKFSQDAAKKLNLRYDEIEGTTKLLKKMIAGPHDHEFVVVRPGQEIRLEHFRIL